MHAEWLVTLAFQMTLCLLLFTSPFVLLLVFFFFFSVFFLLSSEFFFLFSSSLSPQRVSYPFKVASHPDHHGGSKFLVCACIRFSLAGLGPRMARDAAGPKLPLVEVAGSTVWTPFGPVSRRIPDQCGNELRDASSGCLSAARDKASRRARDRRGI